MIPSSPAMTADGNQTWIQQIQTLATNQANAVSVDAQRQYLYRRQRLGRRGRRGPDRAGRRRCLSRQAQFQGQDRWRKTSSAPPAPTAWRPPPPAATAACMSPATQNGHAIVAKYANGDITSAPAWTQDLGALQARRRHRRPGRVERQGLCLRHHQQRQPDGRRPGQHRRGLQRRHRCLCLQHHRQWHQRHRQHRHLCRHRRAATPAAMSRWAATAPSISPAPPPAPSRAPAATSPNVTNAFATAINTNGAVNWTKQYRRRRRHLHRRGHRHRSQRLQRAGCAGPAARRHHA